MSEVCSISLRSPGKATFRWESVIKIHGEKRLIWTLIVSTFLNVCVTKLF